MISYLRIVLQFGDFGGKTGERLASDGGRLGDEDDKRRVLRRSVCVQRTQRDTFYSGHPWDGQIYR